MKIKRFAVQDQAGYTAQAPLEWKAGFARVIVELENGARVDVAVASGEELSLSTDGSLVVMPVAGNRVDVSIVANRDLVGDDAVDATLLDLDCAGVGWARRVVREPDGRPLLAHTFDGHPFEVRFALVRGRYPVFGRDAPLAEAQRAVYGKIGMAGFTGLDGLRRIFQEATVRKAFGLPERGS